MEGVIIAIFAIGYLAITMEHTIHLNKAASALLTGVLCWTVYTLYQPDHHAVEHQLMEHLGEIASIVFFLLGAMVIVELIDAHDGFDNLTALLKTNNQSRLVAGLCLMTFFLSAALDNLTTTIVMISLLRKLFGNQEMRWFMAGLIVIAANAGGAWSPLGDVTTTMLWIGGQITAVNVVKMLILPSLVCLCVPLLIVMRRLSGNFLPPEKDETEVRTTTEFERRLVFFIGLGCLLFVPVFKTVTHLPPFMGMLLGLGVMWVLTEIIHKGKDEADKDHLSVLHALRKTDTPSILFFVGILMAVSALQSTGLLGQLATWLEVQLPDINKLVLTIGLLSSVVDNVPLVAAAQSMYPLSKFATDHYFWEFMAYATGTGGSVLIIGSAAGVAAMGMEKIDFFWYLKKLSWLAAIGYFAGALVYMFLAHGI